MVPQTQSQVSGTVQFSQIHIITVQLISPEVWCDLGSGITAVSVKNINFYKLIKCFP